MKKQNDHMSGHHSPIRSMNHTVSITDGSFSLYSPDSSFLSVDSEYENKPTEKISEDLECSFLIDEEYDTMIHHTIPTTTISPIPLVPLTTHPTQRVIPSLEDEDSFQEYHVPSNIENLTGFVKHNNVYCLLYSRMN